ALVDMQGRVIGINTAIYSKSGGSHGIGFAIPANMVRSVLESARSGGGVVRRPWLGASLQVITSELAETLSLPRPVGALVSSVTSGSPADQVGLKRLDVIQAVDGVEIDDPDGFGFRFATKALGGTMRITVLRGGRKQDLALRLVPAPEIPARNATLIKANSPFQGATVVNISPAVKEEFSISGIDAGVAISEIEPGSSAEQVGFRKGDVIVTLNGQRIEDTAAMDRATARGRTYLWRITFNRGGQTFSTAFGG
ncbi:MAG: PDZ domain-containing protein, partial [Beijerinckiaceae bacterium]|nr:PDZ domain-containing protein [Beijerinckiaceae bacterium]